MRFADIVLSFSDGQRGKPGDNARLGRASGRGQNPLIAMAGVSLNRDRLEWLALGVKHLDDSTFPLCGPSRMRDGIARGCEEKPTICPYRA